MTDDEKDWRGPGVPTYYDQGTIEPINFIHGHEMSFAAGCIAKYLVRYKHKDGKGDLIKARRYLDILIEELG